jgi:hypothetical protein
MPGSNSGDNATSVANTIAQQQAMDTLITTIRDLQRQLTNFATQMTSLPSRMAAVKNRLSS